MKSFRQILGEVAQPKPEEERAFKDMHSYETMPHPVALDHQFTGAIGADDLPREKAKRIADQEGDANYDTSYDDAFEYEGPSFAEQVAKNLTDRLSEGSKAVELVEQRPNSEKEAIKIIASSIAMQVGAVEAALKTANLDPLSVVTALKGKKTIKAMQLGNLVMGHAFGGSISKKDLAPIAKAASSAFKNSRKNVKEEVELDEASAMAKSAALSKASAPSKSGKAKVSLKKAPWDKNEEVELDEISTNTLSNYMVKSTASAGKRGATTRTQDKRISGQKMADDKLRKKGGYKSGAKVAATEEAELEERQMPSKMPARRGGKKGAPKMTGDSIAIQRAKDAEHNAAMGRTRTGRKKPVRTMTSTQKSLASLRRECAGEVELDEASARDARIAAALGKSPAKKYEIKDNKIHISKANFRKVHKDYKNATKGKERMVALDPKTGGTSSFPVVFTESVDLEEGFSPKQIEQLKKAYASMPDRLPVDAAQKMGAILKGRSKEELIAIARADIKWLSTTAATNLIMQGVKAKEITGK